MTTVAEAIQTLSDEKWHKGQDHPACWHPSERRSCGGDRRETDLCCHCGAWRIRRYVLTAPEGHGAHAPKVWTETSA